MCRERQDKLGKQMVEDAIHPYILLGMQHVLFHISAASPTLIKDTRCALGTDLDRRKDSPLHS
jgi:hypothetical protein